MIAGLIDIGLESKPPPALEARALAIVRILLKTHDLKDRFRPNL